jgi:hypothetical protein
MKKEKNKFNAVKFGVQVNKKQKQLLRKHNNINSCYFQLLLRP